MDYHRINATGFICAFPGTGKSTIYDHAPKFNLYPVYANGSCVYRCIRGNRTTVYDSDSSTFDKSDFPGNYIDHMKAVMFRHAGDPFLFLGSCHDVVRHAMRDAGIKYTLVYPSRELKAEYLARYKERGSPIAFIDFMDKNWDSFIDSCESDSSNKIVLRAGEYIADEL